MKIFVFDFDDTLFPTTHLDKTCDCPEKSKWCIDIGKHIKSLDDIKSNILSLLERALFYGDKVYIITNSNRTWITFCFRNMGIDLSEYILSEKFVLITLKDEESLQSIPYEEWKKRKFQELFSENCKELISFGDAYHDRVASMSLKDNFHCIIKNVLLCGSQTEEMLLLQQNLILYSLEKINLFPSHLDLVIRIDSQKDLPFSKEITKEITKENLQVPHL